jgi:AcrR family transcriptional regulator
MAEAARTEPRIMEAPTSAKPYHHGDLQRALVDAAQAILEREGPAALSLRAVAREAGVSPAAPYHHFKDKDELIGAVAKRGFEMLADAMRAATAEQKTDAERSLAIGVAYVCFARDHPAMYHTMFDANRKRDPKFSGPGGRHNSSAYLLALELRERQAAAQGAKPIDAELTTIANWCAAHGLAELCQSKEFDDLKKQLGGDEAFFSAVLGHLGSLQDK